MDAFYITPFLLFFMSHCSLRESMVAVLEFQQLEWFFGVTKYFLKFKKFKYFLNYLPAICYIFSFANFRAVHECFVVSQAGLKIIRTLICTFEEAFVLTSIVDSYSSWIQEQAATMSASQCERLAAISFACKYFFETRKYFLYYEIYSRPKHGLQVCGFHDSTCHYTML